MHAEILHAEISTSSVTSWFGGCNGSRDQSFGQSFFQSFSPIFTNLLLIGTPNLHQSYRQKTVWVNSQTHLGGKIVAGFWESLKKKQDLEKTRKSAPVCISSKTQGVILIIRTHHTHTHKGDWEDDGGAQEGSEYGSLSRRHCKLTCAEKKSKKKEEIKGAKSKKRRWTLSRRKVVYN